MPSPISISHETLFNACVEERTTPFNNYRFIPSSEFPKFLSRDQIKTALQDSLKDATPQQHAELVRYVSEKANKVFLTLIFSDRLKQIGNLFEANFVDEDLPICMDPDWQISTLDDAKKHGPWECFNHEKWRTARKEAFISSQWIFVVPSFYRNQFIYSFPAKQPLPFVLLKDARKDEGRFGLVCEVGIVKGHHDYDTSTRSSPHHFKVALKSIKSIEFDDATVKKFYDREKKTLETMRDLNHPHLIRAVATYERGDDRGFLFPWADGGNLLQFWMANGISGHQNLLPWALQQMRGLAEGIQKLHDKMTRHGDIKPANIVIFKSGQNDKGNLVVADVGLAKFHATYTRDRFVATTTAHGSRRYEPPEVQFPTTKFSRKYDVWSLGCTFLEFLIWLSYSHAGLTNFFKACEEGVTDNRYWDGDSLRQIIKDWIYRLSTDLQTPSLKAILDLIKTRMLIVDVDNRADSAELVQKMPTSQSNDLLEPPYHSGATVKELTSDRHGLAPSAATGLKVSLSENRTSNLRDVWEHVTDNNLADELLKQLQTFAPSPEAPLQASLCSFCQKLDLKPAIIDLDLIFEAVRSVSSTCGFCKLLNHCFLKKNVKFTKPFQLFREGSVLSASRKGPPLVSIYSNPDNLKSDVLSYSQIGLPELPEVASPRQFQLLKEWIKLCDQKHECFQTHGDTSDTGMPTRVLDVGLRAAPSLRLVTPHSTLNEKYVALSHCWGKIPPGQNFVTERGNIDQLMRDIDPDRLPRTFQDAVRTTRELEIRYLWIDSLCIIQDDEDDWNTEAKKMEDVYSHAYVTIAASSAASSRDGFLVDRPSRAYVKVTTPDGALYLAEAIDNFAGHVEKGILNTRAWVLQERALSRRIIHFTSTQIYWECGIGVHCETLAQMRNPQSQFLGDPDFPRLGLAYFKNERIRLFQHLFTVYCALKFTKVSDRSVAISGLLKRLSRTFDMRVDYGIFWKFFERSMLWVAGVSGILSRIRDASDRFMPSWSWMAYSGEITYPDISFGGVEWTGDLRKPAQIEFQEGESQDSTFKTGLVAMARKLNIEGQDWAERVALDTEPWDNFNCSEWKCITVGKDKVAPTAAEVRYYALLIRPLSNSQGRKVYERAGAGMFTKAYFSKEVEEVRLL